MAGASEGTGVQYVTPSMYVSPDEKTWLNGVLFHINSDRCVNVELKVGDTLVFAKGMAYWNAKPISERTFESYHLDRTSKRVAWFTERIYAVKTIPDGREGVRIFPGRLIETKVFTESLEVGDYPIVDGGPWDGVYPVGYSLGQSARTK